MARRLLLWASIALYRRVEAQLESYRSGTAAAHWPGARELWAKILDLWSV